MAELAGADGGGATPPSLSDHAKSIRKTMNESDAGPTLAAAAVMKIAGEWDKYAGESDGLDVSRWLRRYVHPGKGLSFFERRHRAAVCLTRSVAARMHHDGSAWMVDVVPEAKWLALGAEVSKLFRGDNRGACVSLAQVQRLWREMSGAKARPKTCARCDRLEAQLRALDVVPEE